jgi:chromosome partitioning protein
MLQTAVGQGSRRVSNAHVIVLGNEKGGSGKTTLAMHLIVALLKCDRRVGSIDIDSRQQSLSRYVENRRNWALRHEVDLPMPEHATVVLGPENHLKKDEEGEFTAFAEAIGKLEHACDFLVIDAPGSDNYLSRLGHSMADTLVTPINDSFIDLDVLANVDGESYEIRQLSQYSEMVANSRRRRQAVDAGRIDWIAVRNRLSPLNSKNARRIDKVLRHLSPELDLRVAPGVAERVVYRELFPQGLTLFDVMEPGIGDVTMSNLAARIEIRTLLNSLHLPLSRIGPSRPADPQQIVIP